MAALEAVSRGTEMDGGGEAANSGSAAASMNLGDGMQAADGADTRAEVDGSRGTCSSIGEASQAESCYVV